MLSDKQYASLTATKIDAQTVIKDHVQATLAKGYVGPTMTLWFLPNYKDQYMVDMAQALPGPLLINPINLRTLKEIDSFTLPTPELTWRFVNAFFDYLGNDLLFIVKPKFYLDNQDLSNPSSLLHIYAVICCGCLAISNYEVSDPMIKTEYREMASVLYRKARLIFDADFEKDPATLCSSLLCFHWYSKSTTNAMTSQSIYLMKAITIAQSYGMHRNFYMSPYLDDYERSIYKRIWWAIYMEDKMFSFINGKPFSVFLEDCDVPFLNEDDLIVDEKQNFLDIYFSYFKLARTIELVSGKQHSLNPSHTDYANQLLTAVKEGDEHLDEWLTSLPKSLVTTPFPLNIEKKDDSTFPLALRLNLLHNALIISNHQLMIDFLMNNPEGLTPEIYELMYSSWGITFSAAHSIAILTQKMGQLDNSKTHMLHYHTSFALLMAANILLTFLSHGDTNITANADNDIRMIITAMENLAEYQPMGKLGLELLRDMYRTNNIPM